MHVCAIIRINVHIFRAVLRSTRAKTVKTEGILISGVLVVVIVFTACVKLTVNKIPVPSAFCFVVSKGNTAAVVVNLNRMVLICGYFNIKG